MRSKYRRVRKNIRELETRDMYSGERSPYWDFVTRVAKPNVESTAAEYVEDGFANPDMLSEEDSLYVSKLSDEGNDKINLIVRFFPLLSDKQQKALHMVGVQGLSVRQAASVMEVQPSTIQSLLKRAKMKIQREYRKEKRRTVG